MVSAKQAKLILKKYYTPRFPGSFQGVKPFREALKSNLGIEISHEALRRLLKSSPPYQVHLKKPKKFPTRSTYSRGVFQECYLDPIFIPYQGKNFTALIVADVHSRYVYGTYLPSVNPENLKKAFTRLFKKGMPRFGIVRVDRDKSLNALANTYFAERHMLVLPRRSVHHMSWLEGIIKNLKRKFIQALRKSEDNKIWTPKQLQILLADVIQSYNMTVSTSHNFRPHDVNFPQFDPELRLRLYGPNKKIESFDVFYTEQLKLHEKANTPENINDKPNFKEGPQDFKLGDLVYIDYYRPADISRSAYRMQRGADTIYQIARVNVLAQPYIYKLLDIKNGNELLGWYYGRELARADLSELEVERVLRTKTTKDKRTLIYVKWKGLNSSFNRWIEKK